MPQIQESRIKNLNCKINRINQQIGIAKRNKFPYRKLQIIRNETQLELRNLLNPPKKKWFEFWK